MDKYCSFCDFMLENIFYGEFCSIECQKLFYSRNKLLDSLSKSFDVNSNVKLILQIDSKLTEVSSKIFRKEINNK